jgi:hypothetical protein
VLTDDLPGSAINTSLQSIKPIPATSAETDKADHPSSPLNSISSSPLLLDSISNHQSLSSQSLHSPTDSLQQKPASKPHDSPKAFSSPKKPPISIEIDDAGSSLQFTLLPVEVTGPVSKRSSVSSSISEGELSELEGIGSPSLPFDQSFESRERCDTMIDTKPIEDPPAPTPPEKKTFPSANSPLPIAHKKTSLVDDPPFQHRTPPKRHLSKPSRYVLSVSKSTILSQKVHAVLYSGMSDWLA